MNKQMHRLKAWVDDIAALIHDNIDPGVDQIISFVHEPELASHLVDLLNSLDENDIESERSYYSACIFSLDICVAQLKSAAESNNKLAHKILIELMEKLGTTISRYQHSLSFWLPILNAFYNAHVELTANLREAYVELANQEDINTELDDSDHLEAIRSMVLELSDLSTFDIAENFFAQSYAMPADFFIELTIDLFNIDEGQDIAILSLLHPQAEVRQLLLPIFDEMLDDISLHPRSLSRLQAIKAWYPLEAQPRFATWIKKQRLKEVVFDKAQKTAKIIKLYASEIDGRGSQALFLHLKQGRSNKLCGILLSDRFGLKDIWITPPITDSLSYYNENFDTTIILREVPIDYLELMVSHFLALTLAKNSMPDLHLLELQEFLNLSFVPKSIDISAILSNLSNELTINDTAIQASFKRSKSWLHTKAFTESWYVENTHIDKLVNQCSSFVDGVRVCNIEAAMEAVFNDEMETQRDKWLFHFLWVSLWIKARPRKNEKAWQDSFFIAHAIHTGMALAAIPVLQEICYQSIINSIETMNERGTYLHQQ